MASDFTVCSIILSKYGSRKLLICILNVFLTSLRTLWDLTAIVTNFDIFSLCHHLHLPVMWCYYLRVITISLRQTR